MAPDVDAPRPRNAADSYRLDHLPPAWEAVPPAGPFDGILWRAARSTVYGILKAVTGSRADRIDEGGLPLARSGQPVILAANHRSNIDAPLIREGLPAHLRSRYRLVGSAALLRVWGKSADPLRKARGWLLVGILEHGYRAVWVGGEVRGAQAIERLTAALRAGDSLIMHPAGVKGSADELADFQIGVAVASLATGAPVIPVRLDGTAGALPRPGKVRPKARMTAKFRPPILPADYDDPEALLAALVAALQP